jgi:RNA polymerase subunit RPABC4/transcription elongation factor Spt4
VIHLQVINIKQAEHKHTAPPGAQFCPECGELLCLFEISNDYVCSQCRSLISKDAKFCHQCGEQVSSISSTEYWCINNQLDKEGFTNFAIALGIKDVK